MSSLLFKLLVGKGGGGAPVGYFYGARSDAGETNESWTALPYDVATPYKRGATVKAGGFDYWALTDLAAGVSVSDTGSWCKISNYYYVDSTDGLDTYDGLSKYAGYVTNSDGSQGTADAGKGPFKTSYKVRQKLWLAPSDSSGPNGSTVPTMHPAWTASPNASVFLLKRGSTLVGDVYFYAYLDVATYSQNLTLGSYGSGNRPKLKSDKGATQGPLTGLAVVESPVGNLRVGNLEVDAQFCMAIAYTAGTGVFAVDDEITGATSGAIGIVRHVRPGSMTVRVTNTPSKFVGLEAVQTSGGAKTGTLGNPANVGGIAGISITKIGGYVVDSNYVKNTTGNGITVGYAGFPAGANNIVISNNTVERCCASQANGGGIEGGTGDNAKIINNTVVDCGTAGSATNHSIYVGGLTNSLIAGNWCYSTVDLGNHALVMHGDNNFVTIEENLFEKCGNGMGLNAGHSAGETLNNFTVRRNINRFHGTLAGQTQGYSLLTDSMTNSHYYNNISYGNKNGFVVAKTGYGADAFTNNVKFSHETIYNNGSPFSVTGAVVDVVIQNCIFVSTAASGLLLTVDTLAAPGVTLRNCVFYAPNNAGNVISWAGVTYTIAAFLAGPGAGKGHVNANPLFVDAAAGNFKLSAGSPAKNAGFAAGVVDDFDKAVRSIATPTIGAYE